MAAESTTVATLVSSGVTGSYSGSIDDHLRHSLPSLASVDASFRHIVVWLGLHTSLEAPGFADLAGTSSRPLSLAVRGISGGLTQSQRDACRTVGRARAVGVVRPCLA